MTVPDLDPADFLPVQGRFGPGGDAYLVLPRVLLQNMPVWWQRQLITLLDLYDTATENVVQPASYDVRVVEPREVGTLDYRELHAAGCCASYDQMLATDRYFGPDGGELIGADLVLVPQDDPLPPHEDGRTRIPLLAPAADPDAGRSATARADGIRARRDPNTQDTTFDLHWRDTDGAAESFDVDCPELGELLAGNQASTRPWLLTAPYATVGGTPANPVVAVRLTRAGLLAEALFTTRDPRTLCFAGGTVSAARHTLSSPCATVPELLAAMDTATATARRRVLRRSRVRPTEG
jgi:hypothetical protein